MTAERRWVGSARDIRFSWSETGPGIKQTKSPVNFIPAGWDEGWIRVVFTMDGAGGYTADFYHSTNGTDWSVPSTRTGNTSGIAQPTGRPAEVGRHVSAEYFDGNVYKVEVRDASVTRWAPDFTDATEWTDPADLTGDDPQGHTWTLQNGAVIVQPGGGGGPATENRSYTYGEGSAGPHAVTTVTGNTTSSFSYDLVGNQVTRSHDGSTLSYDHQNRMVSYNTGSVTTEFRYDATGQRVTRDDGTTETRYVGGGVEIQITGTTETMRTAYTFAGRTVAVRVDDGASNTVSYLLGDHLGSTSVAYEPASDSAVVSLYHPYGTVRFSDGVLPSDHTYTGQTNDPTTGLLYYGARYHDPLLGRFTQADTIVPDPAHPQDLNRYAYVRNNPVNYIDPSGHVLLSNPVIAGGAFGCGYNSCVGVGPSAPNSMSNQIITTSADVYASGGGADEIIDIMASSVHDDPCYGCYQDPSLPERYVKPGQYKLGGCASVRAGGSEAVSGWCQPPNNDTAFALIDMYGFIFGIFGPTTSPLRFADDALGGMRHATNAMDDILPKPAVSNPKLQNIVDDLYRGTNHPNRVGTGTTADAVRYEAQTGLPVGGRFHTPTADAVRYEAQTGLPVGGRFHTQKAEQYSNALRNVLKTDLSPSDRLVARSLLDDLQSALGGGQ